MSRRASGSSLLQRVQRTSDESSAPQRSAWGSVQLFRALSGSEAQRLGGSEARRYRGSETQRLRARDGAEH
ncbi:hypothetical protein FIV42_23035 [Persicimonas caeni]|uniref:Uncharacterized protein n=1 Tax=Persicimonas caeni TaxID=2292766 RepID=A0A4Y6PZ21_PERCE|nr:hypothetical protein FIV42_23035 [Persicimonas caeni]QED34734.1 hypothetical protein FRD00_23030 [Persicimonas caeni]